MSIQTRKLSRNVEVLAVTRCDLCGRTHDNSKRHDWGDDRYGSTFDRIYVRRSKGWEVPDDSDSDEWVIDICPECWETKLLPWLATQGVVPIPSDS